MLTICGFCLAEMKLGYSLETRGPWKPIGVVGDSLERYSIAASGGMARAASL